ncbi:hypothetical protein BDF22DRAFT_694358 [Syncephalis plumigaleata]|nr:hypothetical protein BDF22DRAFT_694358 [Syncephalis plumigaleata]
MTAETSRSATPVNMNQRIPVVPRSPLYQQTHVIDNTAQQAMPMMMSNGMNVANVAMPHNPPHMVEPVYTANPPLTLIQQQQQMAAAAQQAKLQQQMHHATSSSQMWTPGRVNPAATISPVAVNTGAISPASTPLVAMSPAYPSPRPDMSGTVRTQPAGYVRPGQPTLLQQQQMIQQQQQQQQMQEQFNARLASRQPPLSPPSSVRNSVGFPPQRAQPFVQTVQQQQQQQQQTSMPSSQPQGPAAMNRIQPLISGFSQSPLSGQ